MATVSESAYQFKAAFTEALTPALAGVSWELHWGTPGPANGPDLVMPGRVSATLDAANLNGTNRSREETVTLDVDFVSFRNEDDAQQVSEAYAYRMLGLVERHVRITDPTLGGTVRDCLLTDLESDGVTPPDMKALGRMTVIVATFTAHIRVTG